MCLCVCERTGTVSCRFAPRSVRIHVAVEGNDDGFIFQRSQLPVELLPEKCAFRCVRTVHLQLLIDTDVPHRHRRCRRECRLVASVGAVILRHTCIDIGLVHGVVRNRAQNRVALRDEREWRSHEALSCGPHARKGTRWDE